MTQKGEVALARSLWPMPGGASCYGDSLKVMLRLCSKAENLDSLAEAIVDAFPGVRSPSTAKRYVSLVAYPLGFVDVEGSKVTLTSAGRQFAKSGSRTLLAKQLVERISGVTEILALLEGGPQRIGIIHIELAELGFGWQSDWQIRYRLRWMETAGLIRRRDYRINNRTRQRYPEYLLKHA